MSPLEKTHFVGAVAARMVSADWGSGECECDWDVTIEPHPAKKIPSTSHRCVAIDAEVVEGYLY
jgi:hypothetical protein